MSNLRLIRFTNYLLLTGQILSVALGVLIVVLLIFRPSNPELFSSWVQFTENGMKLIELEENEQHQLSNALFYSVAFRLLIMLVLLYLMQDNLRRILQTIQDLETFHTQNAKSFRRLGWILFIYFLLDLPQVTPVGEQMELTITLSFSFEILVLSLLAFVLAAVFAEGNRLMEENRLTI